MECSEKVTVHWYLCRNMLNQRTDSTSVGNCWQIIWRNWFLFASGTWWTRRTSWTMSKSLVVTYLRTLEMIWKHVGKFGWPISYSYLNHELMNKRLNPKCNPIVQEYVLPDLSSNRKGRIRQYDELVTDADQILVMNNERFSVPELLFHPDDIGMSSVCWNYQFLTLCIQALSSQAFPPLLHYRYRSFRVIFRGCSGLTLV